MMHSKIVILFITLGIFLTSCASLKMAKNNENLLKLKMGMSTDEVISIMGKPDLNEAYKSLNGKPIIIFFYYTQRKWADGTITKDKCTPVVFENGKLIGWGDEFYKTIKFDINIKR